MGLPGVSVPSVYTLMIFLAYSSQWLFLSLEPEPLSTKQLVRFNVLLICLLISYTKAVFVDPGHVPKRYGEDLEKEMEKKTLVQPKKWCRKCNAAKPPRAHHCKECKRLENTHSYPPSEM